MRFDIALLALSLVGSSAASIINTPRHVERVDVTPQNDLFKRRGGGGGGGRGGGGGSGGSSGGKSSGSSKSGSSSSNSGSSSKSSNSGGTSSKGSGVQPTYGGGRYYPGGAAVPYRAGAKSALGIVPFLLLGSAIAFWPGVWLYGAYMYHYDNPYRFYNASSRANETRDVICGCARYAVCGCDDNNSTAYYDELIGNGSYDALNKSIVNVAKVNGTTTILINGTLANGTTVAGEDSAAAGSLQALAEAAGFWPVFATVIATVFLV